MESNLMPEMPQATIRIRVQFGDVDGSQRIHFTAMFRYMEVAEHQLMRSIGMPYATALQGQAFPRVHLECDFRSAILYDDELDVTARMDGVGTSSWTVAFTTCNASRPDSPVAAEGRMVIVAMDPASERAIPLPEELRRALIDASPHHDDTC
jgi:YbgC/YbaW family acyl-CoA thioester hydrolase